MGSWRIIIAGFDKCSVFGGSRLQGVRLSVVKDKSDQSGLFRWQYQEISTD